mmetsp:Transcript_106064/g.304812  ORF Transcript_106064/g.304812 Transcript_106064/m.304812 type:complete len:184 (+) Transcript_106064:283-834(+)
MGSTVEARILDRAGRAERGLGEIAAELNLAEGSGVKATATCVPLKQIGLDTALIVGVPLFVPSSFMFAARSEDTPIVRLAHGICDGHKFKGATIAPSMESGLTGESPWGLEKGALGQMRERQLEVATLEGVRTSPKFNMLVVPTEKGVPCDVHAPVYAAVETVFGDRAPATSCLPPVTSEIFG